MDTSEATNQADSRHVTGKIPFPTNCNAMEFAEMGHLHEVCLDLPVNLLRVLHAKKLECEKSIKSMSSFIIHAFPDQMGQQCCGSTARFFLVGGVQEGK